MRAWQAAGALLLLLVTAAHISSLGANLLTGYVNLGEACYYDEECDTITTFCRDRRVCDCKERFREAEGRCVATVGARCSSTYDCSSLENSECSEETRECECREGYVRHSDYYSCLPIVHVFQGACEEDTQCQESFGDLAICQNSMCECMDGRHFADQKCWHSKGLGEACFNVSECSYDQAQRHRVHCLNGECQCREGYRQKDNECEDGATTLTLSLSALLLVVIRFVLS